MKKKLCTSKKTIYKRAKAESDALRLHDKRFKQFKSSVPAMRKRVDAAMNEAIANARLLAEATERIDVLTKENIRLAAILERYDTTEQQTKITRLGNLLKEMESGSDDAALAVLRRQY